MQSQKFTLNKSNDIIWQHNVFFDQTYLSPSQQSLHHRQPYVNEIAVADTPEAYSNTEPLVKNSNVIDELHTIFT